MSVKKEASGRRSIQVEVEVPGTPEEVWQAIATGPGISSWFVPTEIEERDGKPVAVTHDFGPGMEPRAVRDGLGCAAEVRPARDESWFPARRRSRPSGRVEARAGGVCVVRVVQSLFASTDDWDDQLNAPDVAWPGFFHILRLYLTHFRGQRSAIMQFMAPVAGTRAEAWDALTAALGVNGVSVGQRWTAPAGVPALGRRGGVRHPESVRRPAAARHSRGRASPPLAPSIYGGQSHGGVELLPLRRSGGRNRRPRDAACGRRGSRNASRCRRSRAAANENAQDHRTHLAGRRDAALSRRRRLPLRRLDRALSNARWPGRWLRPRMASASTCCSAVAPTMGGRASGPRRRAVRSATASTRPRSTSRPTVRKVSSGARSRPLDRTSSKAFAASSRRTARTSILSGSSTLTSTVLEHGLADEVVLIVYPVLLGTGKRFFADGTPAHDIRARRTRKQRRPASSSPRTRSLGPLKTGIGRRMHDSSVRGFSRSRCRPSGCRTSPTPRPPPMAVACVPPRTAPPRCASRFRTRTSPPRAPSCQTTRCARSARSRIVASRPPSTRKRTSSHCSRTTGTVAS